MEEFANLSIHFIALIFLIGPLENLEQFLEDLFHVNIPDWAGFFVIWLLALFIVWAGDWRFMSFLGYNTVYPWAIWIDWGLAALIIAAGSNKLEKKFDVINKIPMLVSGISTVIRPSARNKKETDVPASLPQEHFTGHREHHDDKLGPRFHSDDPRI